MRRVGQLPSAPGSRGWWSRQLGPIRGRLVSVRDERGPAIEARIMRLLMRLPENMLTQHRKRRMCTLLEAGRGHLMVKLTTTSRGGLGHLWAA